MDLSTGVEARGQVAGVNKLYAGHASQKPGLAADAFPCWAILLASLALSF